MKKSLIALAFVSAFAAPACTEEAAPAPALTGNIGLVSNYIFLLAFVFGFFAFRSRIKGVYFSIITQAMTYAAMLLFFRNETG